jgi:hypothetical protein
MYSVVYPPAFSAGGGHTRWVERGMGVNILEDARHSSVLCICKYFVLLGIQEIPRFVRAPVHAKYIVKKILFTLQTSCILIL